MTPDPSDMPAAAADDVLHPLSLRACALAVTLAVLATACAAWGLFLWVR